MDKIKFCKCFFPCYILGDKVKADNNIIEYWIICKKCGLSKKK